VTTALLSAFYRGLGLTALLLPASYLTGVSLDYSGLALAVALAVYHSWRRK